MLCRRSTACAGSRPATSRKRPPLSSARTISGAHRAAADPTRRAVPEKEPAPWDALPDPAPGAGRPERADAHARNAAGGDRHDG